MLIELFDRLQLYRLSPRKGIPGSARPRVSRPGDPSFRPVAPQQRYRELSDVAINDPGRWHGTRVPAPGPDSSPVQET